MFPHNPKLSTRKPQALDPKAQNLKLSGHKPCSPIKPETPQPHNSRPKPSKAIFTTPKSLKPRSPWHSKSLLRADILVDALVCRPRLPSNLPVLRLWLNRAPRREYVRRRRCIYIYIYTYTHVSIYVYVYIYIERLLYESMPKLPASHQQL